ncbi:MAG: DUF58 domain-containing protein, partial [Clostridia bacterium]|nr:DUF58 domain-containing protein [Clostridia bacterium]
LRFDRRGVYDIGDYQIAVGDLLGFRELPKLGSGKELVIIPARATHRPSIDAFGGFLGDVSVRRFILEDPVLTVGFRDYTGREPLKSVSWTRTAVAGKLQVKQFDHTAEQTVTVLLNVSGASETALEECFSLVRTVCETLEKQKIPYGFRTNGNLPGPTGRIESMPDGLGHSHLSNILYALGRADDTCFRSWKALTVEALKHRKAGESFVVITPPLDADDGEILRRFTAAAVNPVCVLTAEEENA